MSSSKSDRVRIIGGLWKGRKIPVLSKANIRPTGDRVKTTLFNWLTFELPGARALDLFAGTGALGIEALSRGAVHTTLVEKNRRVVQQLYALSIQLNLEKAQLKIVNSDAIRWLPHQQDFWDVVFVDPPFAERSYYEKILECIAPKLNRSGLVYVESSKRDEIQFPDMEVWKQSVVGEVRMTLLRRRM